MAPRTVRAIVLTALLVGCSGAPFTDDAPNANELAPANASFPAADASVSTPPEAGSLENAVTDSAPESEADATSDVKAHCPECACWQDYLCCNGKWEPVCDLYDCEACQ